MARPPGRRAEEYQEGEEGEESLNSVSEDERTDERQETPDIYRNSALGM
jgi:hypothetical protein